MGAAPSPHAEAPRAAEVLLRGAAVVDGTGADPVTADVLVRDGVIAAMGSIGPAAQVVDCDGLVLSPGFIDIHTHSDVSLLHDDAAESKILQGVTTEVPGNCGFSAFPLSTEHRDLHIDHLARLGDETLELGDLSWSDLRGYSARLTRRPPALNVATLVGHGTLRVAAMGVEQRRPTVAELRTMATLLDAALTQGAFGMSTGLTHIPSGYGEPAEVSELVHVLARRGALYTTHLRGTAGEDFPALREALDTSAGAGARLQVSHAAINRPSEWGRAGDYTSLIDEAADRGLDVAFDVYPYDASSSSLTQYLPPWTQAGGTDRMRAVLSNPDQRRRAETELAEGWGSGIPWYWDRVVFSRTGPGHEDLVGLSVRDASERTGSAPQALVLDLCLAHGNEVQVVLFYRTEEDMRTFLSHPRSVVASDGSAVPLDQQGQQPHPRGFGTFARVLGRYVRDTGLLSLPEAVHKMTGAAARRLQITDRGLIRVGMAADLVAFDPGAVRDNATFTHPARPPQGIHHVLVNGSFAVRSGRQTSARTGRVLRRRPPPTSSNRRDVPTATERTI